MNLSPEKKKKITLWIIEIATACILIFLLVQNIHVVTYALGHCFKALSPLLWGFILALIFNVPMKFFESHLWPNAKKTFWIKLRSPVSFIISLVIILGILVGIVWLVIPELIDATKIIVQGVTTLIEKLQSMEDMEIAGFSLNKIIGNVDWDQLLSEIQNWFKDKSGTIVNTALSTVFSLIGGVVDFFIAFVFSIYILFSKETLKSHTERLIKAWIPSRHAKVTIHVAIVANKNFRNFISGQTLEAVILGVLCMLGMMLLRIPYAPMVGALVGITALIPVVGGFIGAGVGAFMILTVSPVKALVFVIYLIILQQIEGNVIYPKVMGSKVNLPAIWILVAVTVGGAVGGVVGMFLSVPITSTAYLLLKEATKTKEQKNRNSSSVNTLKINHRPKINRKRNNIKRFRKNTNNNQKK